MPQIFLEYTDNIIGINFYDMLIEIHNILSKKLPTDINSCKSRIIKREDYLIGDGNLNNALVNIDISVLPGRKEELLSLIANEIKSEIKLFFEGNSITLILQICVSIKELPTIYYKELHTVK
jgi:5-carboxymethyl-2-hydroxymuconate isomerase